MRKRESNQLRNYYYNKSLRLVYEEKNNRESGEEIRP
jgi:hypothetical protein